MEKGNSNNFSFPKVSQNFKTNKCLYSFVGEKFRYGRTFGFSTTNAVPRKVL